MATGKNTKPSKTPTSAAVKRHRKPTAKASAPPAPKQPKIKLKAVRRPAKEPTPDDTARGVDAPGKPAISISSSSPAPEQEPLSEQEPSPEPERSVHHVSVYFRVFLDHKLAYAETFTKQDFHSPLRYDYRHYKVWARQKAEEEAVNRRVDKPLKVRNKWVVIYGPKNAPQVHHIQDRESWERFEQMMISRGSKGQDCTIDVKFVTKGDPNSSPEPEKPGKRRKPSDPPRLVYSDDDIEVKKSTNVPPVKKARKTATTVAVESLVEERKTQSLYMDRLSLLSNHWRCDGGKQLDCPNRNRQCFVHGDNHYAIEIDDFHVWTKQWREEVSDEANMTLVPTDLVIKWIQNGEGIQRKGGRRIESKGKAKAKTIVKTEEGEASSQPTGSIINHNYYGDGFKKEEIAPSPTLYGVSQAPPRRRPAYDEFLDAIPPPEWVAMEQASRRRAEYLPPPRTNSPYFQQRRPSPPSLRHQYRVRQAESPSSVFDMRSLRESSPIRGDADVEVELASFSAWLESHLPANRQSDIRSLISTATKEKIDPNQLKSMGKTDAMDHGIPWGFLLAVKEQVSPWRSLWNSQVVQCSMLPRDSIAPTANMAASSQSTIPARHTGDSIRTDIVFGTYPEDEAVFQQGVGNSQKEDWADFFNNSMFGDGYGEEEEDRDEEY